jgi:hypothetical protein
LPLNPKSRVESAPAVRHWAYRRSLSTPVPRPDRPHRRRGRPAISTDIAANHPTNINARP